MKDLRDKKRYRIAIAILDSFTHQVQIDIKNLSFDEANIVIKELENKYR